MKSIQDDFSNIDSSKWAVGDKASLGKLQVDPDAPTMLTLHCSGCGEPVGWFGGAPRTVGIIHYVEFECPCGAITEFKTTRKECAR